MIQNNRHGWGTFQLGNFTGRISYIEDVPVDLLQAFIDWREKGSGCAWIDEEGTEFTFVLTPYSMFVISERNNTELFNLSEFKFEEIEKELIDDIESDLDGWSEFLLNDDLEEIQSHRERICTKLSILKVLRGKQ